ncbi:MAG: hypothetical protein H0X27_09220 [Caulobacteraceae bacterium]|nr:hypothetical protein [Caulobacteraceae bacterium]
MDRVVEIRARSQPAAFIALTGAVLALFLSASASAQPAHDPGSVCYTQSGWCFAQPPGPPGSPCACPSPGGLISGVRG